MNHEALRRKALAMGAKLEIDGKIFNAARVEGTHTPKVVPIKPPEQKPQVQSNTRSIQLEVTQVPDESIQNIEAYAAASFLLADEQAKVVESNQKLIALMTHQLTKPESKKPKGWVFKINKDNNGNMTSIEATPKE